MKKSKNMACLEKEQKEKIAYCCTINKDLVAYKIHYFLLSGAHVGVIPYLPVYAKTTLGCSATTVGILATCMQFSTTISKPMFGLLADCLNQMKILIAALLAFEVLLNLLMLTLPPVTVKGFSNSSAFSSDSRTLLRIAPARVYDTSVGFHSQPKSHHFISNGLSHELNFRNVVRKKNLNGSSVYIIENLSQTSAPQFSTWHHHLRRNLHHQCYLNCDSFISGAICYQNTSTCIETGRINLLNCRLGRRRAIPFCKGLQTSPNFTFRYEIKDNLDDRKSLQACDLISHSFIYHRTSNRQRKSFACSGTNISCSLDCQESVKLCAENSTDENNIFKTYQFWVFCVFALLGSMCQGAVYTLSDTVCYERLRGTTADFGRQRLWAAVGWGAIAPISGYLNDLVTGKSIQEDYTSGWYIMTILSFCFLVNLYCMTFPKTKKSPSMCQDVKGVLCSKQFVFMEINIFFVGVLTAYSTNYFMWYMATLGSSSIQMGLSLAVACLLGEAPFMYCSGWLISKLGHWNVITLTFLAFAVRFGAYYMLVDPWMVLPIELIDGITFGLFYTAMTSFGEMMVTPGTEATIQGILGGTYQGLGSGVGCLLAGISFDRYGGRLSFLLVSIMAACLALCHYMLCLICKPQKRHSANLNETFKFYT